METANEWAFCTEQTVNQLFYCNWIQFSNAAAKDVNITESLYVEVYSISDSKVATNGTVNSVTTQNVNAIAS